MYNFLKFIEEIIVCNKLNNIYVIYKIVLLFLQIVLDVNNFFYITKK